MNSVEVTDIINRCKSHDRKAQYELYQMYSKAMYNVSYRILSDHASAEDALQMAFVKVFKNLKSYKQEATVGAWIKRIVINTSLSELKKNKVIFQEIEDSDFVDESTYESVDHSLDIQRVQAAILALSDGYRSIFSMYAIEGYDHKEISEIMGISVGTSKSQYSRAKAKIKQLLSNDERISNTP